jgi:hypothetical protein
MTTQTNGKQTAEQLLVRGLVNQDVKFIFGIPGGKIMPTFDLLNDEDPRSLSAGMSKLRRSWRRAAACPGGQALA